MPCPIVRFWWPEIPLWLTTIVFSIAILGANASAVKLFGKVESRPDPRLRRRLVGPVGERHSSASGRRREAPPSPACSDVIENIFAILPGNQITCELCHPPVAQLMICGGRVLPVRSAGAVGANPPQESLRPTYRRGKATLESSPGNRAHRRCKWRAAISRAKRKLSGPIQSGEEPESSWRQDAT